MLRRVKAVVFVLVSLAAPFRPAIAQWLSCESVRKSQATMPGMLEDILEGKQSDKPLFDAEVELVDAALSVLSIRVRS
jgi:hypothetical protein